MFKFIRQYADKINDIEIYPLISLLIFVPFFIEVLYYVIKMRKAKVEELKNIPFDEN